MTAPDVCESDVNSTLVSASALGQNSEQAHADAYSEFQSPALAHSGLISEQEARLLARGEYVMCFRCWACTRSPASSVYAAFYRVPWRWMC